MPGLIRDGLRVAFRRPDRALALAVAVCAFAMAAPEARAYVYWSNDGAGLSGSGTTLGRANLDGGGVNASLVSGASSPGEIAVDAAHVYWATGTSIGRANLNGSGADPSFIATGAPVTGVALDGTSIWWTDGAQYVGRANIDGTGTPVPHCIDAGAFSLPSGIAVAAGKLYLGEPNQIAQVAAACNQTPTTLAAINPSLTYPPLGLAVADGYVYFPAADLKGSAIDRVLTSGGAPQVYVNGLDFPTAVAVDGNYVYWADHGTEEIGRTPLSNPTDPQLDFISDSAGPGGVAVDAGVDRTATSVSCTPGSVAPESTTACKATVTDTASSEPASGTVVFSGTGTTAFIGGSSSCTLSPDGSGGMSCVVGAVPTVAGSAPITATYLGDASHSNSQGTSNVCAGTVTQCSASTQAPPTTTTTTTQTQLTNTAQPQTPVCVVPNVAGKTLATAERLIKRAGCAVGKITQPNGRKRHRRAAMIVQRTRAAAGRSVAKGTKVAIVLTYARSPGTRS